jgi:hypothetical protein
MIVFLLAAILLVLLFGGRMRAICRAAQTLTLIVLVGCVSMSSCTKAQADTLFERDAQFDEYMQTHPEAVIAMVHQAQQDGHRCDSVSMAKLGVFTKGLALYCDHFKYQYVILKGNDGYYTQPDGK